MAQKEWKEIAELIGIAAIVGSLIFVGMQMRQTHQIALANQYQARFESVREINATRIESDVALRVMGETVSQVASEDGSIPQSFRDLIDDMPIEEVGFRYLDAHTMLKQFDNLYFQYKSDFLDEQSWQSLRSSLIAILVDDGPYSEFARVVFTHGAAGLNPEFRAEVERIMESHGSVGAR